LPARTGQLLVERQLTRQLVQPVGDHDQERKGREAGTEEAEQFEAGGVRPVHVFQQDQHRLQAGELGEVVEDVGDECGLAPEFREVPIGECFGKRWRAGHIRDPCGKIQPRRVWRDRRQLVAMAGQAERAFAPGCFQHIERKGGFSDARLPGDDRKSALATECE
jgi:hypothetical protein